LLLLAKKRTALTSNLHEQMRDGANGQALSALVAGDWKIKAPAYQAANINIRRLQRELPVAVQTGMAWRRTRVPTRCINITTLPLLEVN
jgi:hypothetical protein